MKLTPTATVAELFEMPADTKTGDKILDAVIEVIRSSHTLLVNDVAKELGVNRTDLSGAIRLLTGVSLVDMIHEWRLLQAMKLIKETDLDFLSIANTCGFTKAEHLSEALEREHHVTPYELRHGCHRNDIRRHRRKMALLAAQTPQVEPDSVSEKS